MCWVQAMWKENCEMQADKLQGVDMQVYIDHEIGGCEGESDSSWFIYSVASERNVLYATQVLSTSLRCLVRGILVSCGYNE